MKILFFSILYHNYTRAIIDEMISLGASVTFVDIQPRSFGYKVVRTLARGPYELMVQQQLAEAVSAARSEAYDKVVFLQAHQMPLNLLQELRQTQPRAEFSLYNWDSLRTHDYRRQADYFDRVLTFDRQDAEAHRFGYLPLFCIRRWQDLVIDLVAPRTVYMVGNIVRLERYRAVEQFRAACRSNGVTFREHLKISPVVFAGAVRHGVWPQGVSLRSISEQRFAEMIETSLAAFDFANHAQSGQTMRVMESLCSGKKIITNNQWVKKEPFYSPDRIHVFEGTDYSGVPAFLETPLADPSERFTEYYIQYFTRKLVGLEPVPITLGNI
jgi:hypothetical protein